VKVHKLIAEYADRLSDLYVCDFNSLTDVAQQLDSLGELKEYLKIFVKEKEQAYRVKIERKLYGRHYSQRESSGGAGGSAGGVQQGDRKKRKRDEYEEDDDDEEYTEGRRRSGG